MKFKPKIPTLQDFFQSQKFKTHLKKLSNSKQQTFGGTTSQNSCLQNIERQNINSSEKKETQILRWK